MFPLRANYICSENTVDFNADKMQLYEQVRRAMAGKYATENYFGPVEMTNPEKPDTEAGIIKTGYKRIKEK